MGEQKPIVNIADAQLTDFGNGQAFAAKRARLGQMLGSSRLGCTLLVVPPGKTAFPFHRHHVMDEMFFVVSGSGEYRHGDERLPLRAGDLIAAPAGGAAHQIVNTSGEDIRYLAFSSSIGGVDVCEYPDTGKVGIVAGIRDADFKTATYMGLGKLDPSDYWEGEAGAPSK